MPGASGNIEADERAQDRPGDQLAFAADVNDSGPKGDADAQRDQQQGCGAHDRVGQGILAAERALEQRPISSDGVGSQQLEHDRPHPQRGERRQ